MGGGTVLDHRSVGRMVGAVVSHSRPGRGHAGVSPRVREVGGWVGRGAVGQVGAGVSDRQGSPVRALWIWRQRPPPGWFLGEC